MRANPVQEYRGDPATEVDPVRGRAARRRRRVGDIELKPGLADFAVVRSYVSTAAKWGINSLDAFEQLFTTGAWLPPATAPC